MPPMQRRSRKRCQTPMLPRKTTFPVHHRLITRVVLVGGQTEGYSVISMRLHRRGLLHQGIALLLAAVMPLCCCVVAGLSGGSCCSGAAPIQVAAAPSCCQQAPAEQAPAPCEGESRCSCCIKAPAPSFDWTPPVDTIGAPSLAIALLANDQQILLAMLDRPAHRAHAPPPSWLSAAAHRGVVILNC